uniref:Transmembrane protein n=1 Tax=Lotharella oceanica TaxID=641309 RepID=A0A7S2TMJ2_9EUKA|mmetsp:Transcript_21118/g.39635  ORF Transcript_21118/g.39635 Transcript_21118/m.39635 type:complete len:150 (+) Transcript_21118:35-484(+)
MATYHADSFNHPLLPSDVTSVGYDDRYGTAELGLAPGHRSRTWCARLGSLLQSSCAGLVALLALFLIFVLPLGLIAVGVTCVSTHMLCPRNSGLQGALVEIVIGMLPVCICLGYCCMSRDPSTFVCRVAIAIIEFTQHGGTEKDIGAQR